MSIYLNETERRAFARVVRKAIETHVRPRRRAHDSCSTASHSTEEHDMPAAEPKTKRKPRRSDEELLADARAEVARLEARVKTNDVELKFEAAEQEEVQARDFAEECIKGYVEMSAPDDNAVAMTREAMLEALAEHGKAVVARAQAERALRLAKSNSA